MEEVQTLCPRIAILDHGRLVACDWREKLLRLLEGTIRISIAGNLSDAARKLAEAPGLRIASTEGTTITLATNDIPEAVAKAVNALRELNVEVTKIETSEPTLEQVFLHLTEKTLRD
jgi:ABC-2 type transport system ATP-binding protein